MIHVGSRMIRVLTTQNVDFAHGAARMIRNFWSLPSSQNRVRSPARENQMIVELFDLIGGKQIVSAATEDFYRRVLADETLRPFFATTDMGQLLARQRMFLSMLLGGKASYTGRDISSVHGQARRQGLNDGHFDRFLKHFREALKGVGVEPDKIEVVMKLLESRRGAVLNP